MEKQTMNQGFGFAQQVIGGGESRNVHTMVKDTRRMVTGDPDDVEMHGEFTILITAKAATLGDIAEAYLNARILRLVADLGDMVCPYTATQDRITGDNGESRIRVIGLDEIGDVLLQIYRGERTCSAVASREMAQFDPANYSKAGEDAMRVIGWMRDVARAIQQYRSALISEDGSAQQAWDAVTATVYAR